jgi:hypothetical protein
MRKRIFIVPLMPFLAILWALGWALSGNGGEKPRNRHVDMATKSIAIVHVASVRSVFASNNHSLIKENKDGHSVSM